MAYSLQGLRYESVDSNKVTSHIPTVTVESHEAVDKISAYMDQRRAVHTRQLIPVLLTAKVNDKRLVAVYSESSPNYCNRCLNEFKCGHIYSQVATF